MSRRTVRDAWLAEVMFTQRVNDPCRRLLLAFALAGDGRGPWMNERGRVRPITHRVIGEALTIAEKTVANRILEATHAGLLQKDPTTGYRGRAAAYQATLPPREKAPSDGPISLRSLVLGAIKVPVNEEPFSVDPGEPFSRSDARKVPGSREAQRARVTQVTPNNGTPSAGDRGSPEQQSGGESSAPRPQPSLRIAPPIRRAASA